jgi:hypothetical protein
MGSARVMLCLASGLLGLSAEPGATQQQQGSLATYRNERHGFSFDYPARLFAPERPSEVADGNVFVSPDGNARLLAGALRNTEGINLRAYRALVLQRSYPDAAIDYAPVRGTWFVLSGTRDGQMFYERVTFTCGGQLINSWAMLYPASERRVYDRVVEQVARSYRAGTASCG